MSINDNVFSGYFVVSDDMVILPERIKDFDKTSIWMPNMIIANLTTGKCSKTLLIQTYVRIVIYFLFGNDMQLNLSWPEENIVSLC